MPKKSAQCLVDTIAWRGEITARPDDAFVVREVELQTGEVLQRKDYGVTPSGAQWKVRSINGVLYADVEMSIPRFLTGSNVHGVTLTEGIEGLCTLDAEVGQFLRWATSDPLSRALQRVDVVRDFTGVINRQALLWALEAVSPFRGGRVLHADPSRGGAPSLEVVRTDWSLALYDKAAERLHRRDAVNAARAEGIMRCELRLRRRRLRDGLRIDRVVDLDQDILAGEHAAKWLDLGFGTEVVALADWKQAVWADPVLTEIKKCTFIGVMTALADGTPPAISDDTLRKYLQVAKRLGVPAPDRLGMTGSVHLDYDSATMVAKS